MKTSVKHIIVAAIAAPLFFSFNLSEKKTGRNTHEELPQYHYRYIEKVWTAGADYSKNSKSATYTEYHPNNCVTIFTGNNAYVGSAHLSRVSNGKVTISITLDEGWQLMPGKESVCIQGYANAPKGRPNPDQFEYRGNQLVAEVNVSKYYGIHLQIGK